MDDSVELQAACAALGYLDGDKYHKEPDCLGNQRHGCLFVSIIDASNIHRLSGTYYSFMGMIRLLTVMLCA